jgi:hypothetical protein
MTWRCNEDLYWVANKGEKCSLKWFGCDKSQFEDCVLQNWVSENRLRKWRLSSHKSKSDLHGQLDRHRMWSAIMDIHWTIVRRIFDLDRVLNRIIYDSNIIVQRFSLQEKGHHFVHMSCYIVPQKTWSKSERINFRLLISFSWVSGIAAIYLCIG